MPFTLAHPAASVPFARNKNLILSALVIGSMAPDFEYFLPWSYQERYGHTLPGILYFSIPMAIVVYVLFHALLKEALVSLLPLSHQKRLMPLIENFSFGPKKRVGMAFLSIVIGVLTHVIWDSFTHIDSSAIHYFPILRQTIFRLGLSEISTYTFLQYGCSILGLGLLLYWYRSWFYRCPKGLKISDRHIPEATRIIILIMMALGIILGGFLFTFVEEGITAFPFSLRVWADYIHDLAVIFLSVLLVEIFIYSISWRVYHLRKSS